MTESSTTATMALWGEVVLPKIITLIKKKLHLILIDLSSVITIKTIDIDYLSFCYLSTTGNIYQQALDVLLNTAQKHRKAVVWCHLLDEINSVHRRWTYRDVGSAFPQGNV